MLTFSHDELILLALALGLTCFAVGFIFGTAGRLPMTPHHPVTPAWRVVDPQTSAPLTAWRPGEPSPEQQQIEEERGFSIERIQTVGA